jgi:hypothetical protein
MTFDILREIASEDNFPGDRDLSFLDALVAGYHTAASQRTSSDYSIYDRFDVDRMCTVYLSVLNEFTNSPAEIHKRLVESLKGIITHEKDIVLQEKAIRVLCHLSITDGFLLGLDLLGIRGEKDEYDYAWLLRYMFTETDDSYYGRTYYKGFCDLLSEEALEDLAYKRRYDADFDIDKYKKPREDVKIFKVWLNENAASIHSHQIDKKTIDKLRKRLEIKSEELMEAAER